MLIANTKKYIINLKRREDRRKKAIKEMEYVGWNNYELFEAIDTNSYIGCAKSHVALARKLLDSNEQYIIVVEDDLFFMPWANILLEKLDSIIGNEEIDILHFAPSIHRRLDSSKGLLVSLHDCPPLRDFDRGILGTTGFIYNRKVAEILCTWDTSFVGAIDEYFNEKVYPNVKSCCPCYPLFTQQKGYSDINYTIDNNLYAMLYQWNSLIKPLPFNNFDHDYLLQCRENKNSLVTL